MSDGKPRVLDSTIARLILGHVPEEGEGDRGLSAAIHDPTAEATRDLLREALGGAVSSAGPRFKVKMP